MHSFSKILFVSAVFVSHLASAQYVCSSKTLGEFYSSAKAIDSRDTPIKVLRKYRDFDFVRFRPVEGKIDSGYFDVGFDANEHICQITRIEPSNDGYSYRLMVRDSERFRILILKTRAPRETEFMFRAVAIFTMKDNGASYMINFSAHMDDERRYYPSTTFETFDLGRFDEISCVMRLNANLYPISMIRLIISRVVEVCNFEYSKTSPREILKEKADIFLGRTHEPKLILTERDCPDNVVMRCETVEPDIYVHLKPKMHENATSPLWIFGGAHDYEL